MATVKIGDPNVDLSGNTVVGGGYSSVTGSITIDPSWTTTTIASNAYNWTSPVYNGGTYSITGSSNYDPNVSISSDGITMKDGCDIKIGDRKLGDILSALEERLAILHPNPELESKWDELKELGKRYKELEAEIKEKEKVWKILKQK